jgi:hypothetical protein
MDLTVRADLIAHQGAASGCSCGKCGADRGEFRMTIWLIR